MPAAVSLSILHFFFAICNSFCTQRFLKKIPPGETSPAADENISGKEFPGGQIQAVPFPVGQAHPGGGADILQMRGVHGARDGLHPGRMPQDPRDGHGGFRHAVGIADFAERLVQLREIGMIHKAAPNMPNCSGDQVWTVISCRRQ